MTEEEMKDSNYDPNKLPKLINKSKGKSQNHEKNKFRNNNSEGTNGMPHYSFGFSPVERRRIPH